MRPSQDIKNVPSWLMRIWLEKDGDARGMDALARLLGGVRMEVTVDPAGTNIVHDLGRTPEGVISWIPVGHSESLVQGDSAPTSKTIYLRTSGTSKGRKFIIVLA